ncbi:MAG: hypothetical protein JW751_24550 [Polyangiaceae bacterium]|nr:hypothetical protein [Polyangiaceae bacterium]
MRLEILADILRSPGRVLERCHDDRCARDIALAALVAIAVGGTVFGATVGTFRGGLQVLLAALKLPLATLLALALSGPILHAVATTFDRRWRLTTVLAVMLAAGARASLVLLAAAPALLLLVGFGGSYLGLKLAATAAYALAGLSALSFLLRSLGPESGRWPAAAVFIGLFLIAGGQAAWVLRPYIGDPRDEGVIVVTARKEGGLMGALGAAVRSLGEGSEHHEYP